jgi:hypothetical protein
MTPHQHLEQQGFALEDSHHDFFVQQGAWWPYRACMCIRHRVLLTVPNRVTRRQKVTEPFSVTFPATATPFGWRQMRNLALAIGPINNSWPGKQGEFVMTKLSLAFVVAFGAVQVASAGGLQPAPQHHGARVSAREALRQDMRKLWTDHVIWTRAYIVAAIGDQPDAQAAAGRLMKNQEDIGAAVATYYGKAAGDKVTALLKEHISIAVDLIKFAKAGDKTSQQQANAKWLRNGEDIADFLSKANPNWPRAVLAQMMNTHLSTTTDEVVARLNKNWDADTRAFDTVIRPHIRTIVSRPKRHRQADAMTGTVANSSGGSVAE